MTEALKLSNEIVIHLLAIVVMGIVIWIPLKLAGMLADSHHQMWLEKYGVRTR